jgi:hypothetical protein
VQASLLSVQASTASAARSTDTCSARRAELFRRRQAWADLQVRSKPKDGRPGWWLPRHRLLLGLSELWQLLRLWNVQEVLAGRPAAASTATQPTDPRCDVPAQHESTAVLSRWHQVPHVWQAGMPLPPRSASSRAGTAAALQQQRPSVLEWQLLSQRQCAHRWAERLHVFPHPNRDQDQHW